ncbi:hypothetical protein I7F13_04930 [Sinorhizobium meliloti]|nr:hypothetical protein [Sinorhizobium meliloti]RVM40401.1 hypothetical protein CN127_31840 [Sinorhizobium meliloti]RVN55165.1 hypothetical protein CN106_35215 [Sinorhizobium meliloti]
MPFRPAYLNPFSFSNNRSLKNKMDTTNPTARAMALVHELTKAEGVSDDLRARAIKLITEVAPETLEPNFDPLTAIVKLGALVRERKEAAELRTRLGDGVVVLRELDPNSDVVKDVAKFVNALNEGTASTQTPAKVFTRKDMKRVNFLTGEGVAEAKEKALSILLDAYRGDIALFAKQVFGAKLTPEQITFCEEFRTERTITRHEPPAWGKTYVAAIAVWWSLVCFDDVKVTIFGPSESLIKNGMWSNLQALHARMASSFKDLFDVSATRISRKTDAPSCFAEYRLVSADNASAARGIHAVNNFVFVDDADGVSEVVIAYLQNIMIDRNPKLCLLSTKFANETPKPETATEAELFNEALSSLRAMVSGEVRTDPVRLEAIRYQLENADYLSENAKRVE